MTDQGLKREAYAQRDNPAVEALIRRADGHPEAGFFLPHLRPGMLVLDVGCGPGSITLGLARVVVPGEVVGTDLQQSLVQRARDLAVERGVSNVRFEVGDAYRLPFPDLSFDAVFARAVLRTTVNRATTKMQIRRGGIIREHAWR